MRSYDAEPMSIGKKQTFLPRTWEGKAFQTGTRSGSPLIGDRFERTEGRHALIPLGSTSGPLKRLVSAPKNAVPAG